MNTKRIFLLLSTVYFFMLGCSPKKPYPNNETYSGSPTINVKRGERYTIRLNASDPGGGLKFIKFNPSVGDGEMSWQCQTTSGGEHLAQDKDALLGSKTQNFAPATTSGLI